MKATALLLLALSLTACHRENSGPLIEELRRESALSKTEQDECTKYQEAAPKVAEGEWDNPTHSSKAEGLAALAYLEKLPRRHPHTDRIEEIFRGHFAELAQLPNQDEVISTQQYEAGACGIFVEYQHGVKLMSDKKKFGFTPAERKRTDQVMRAILTDHTGVPVSVIARAVQLTILKKYIELEYHGNDRLELITTAQKAINEFEADRPKMTAAAKEAERLAGGNTLNYQKYEREVQRRMAGQHAEIVRKLFP